ncbi:TonB-dependent receptor domain-containing protein [Alloalcanivorax sp. C16-1]|uniref:TonB-dependent receptor domain-containing protein n=1 Tax=Alloalcanivorax sp. C16-1 TaxID=3390051 RepID=UPI0039709838
MKRVIFPMAAATLAAMGGSVAVAQPADSNDNRLDAVEVSALPLGSDANLTPASYDLLEDELLFQQSEATLGDTLNGLPGVHADTFGGGSSRPVIRGQTAPRVSVLSDGAQLFDMSAISPDHATTVEPMLSRKVEVLRGPSTLLYGGGAIGGVVNVLDDKIPTRMPDGPVQGFFEGRGNTVADEGAAAFGLTTRAGDHLALHVEGARRDADDYEINGFTDKTVDGTWAESNNGSVGLSWIGDRGYLGLAYSYRGDLYGLPGHSHEFEGCSANGSSLECAEEEHDHEHGAHQAPFVDLDSRRVDLRGEYRQPVAGIEAVRLRASHTDYRHHEIEEDVIGTTFRHRGVDARVEAEHAPILGWRGTFGTQVTDGRIETSGEEAVVPKTDTRTAAVFAVERYRFNERWQLEAGARFEHQKLDPDDADRPLPSYSESATSLSTALTWAFRPDYNVSVSLARSERLPQAQEVYARGVHLATNTYECGLLADSFTCGGTANDAGLETETSYNAGINLRKVSGALTFDLGLFHNRVNDYVYARTLDQIEEFRLIKYSQADVEFTGAEAEATYQWTERFSTTLFGDTVRGEFKDGGDSLPRIPAHRLGARVNTFWRAFDGEVEFYRVFAQDDIAAFETRTPGHDMLNATVSYTFTGKPQYNVFLRASNLLGEEVWNHASFLARTVPEPGRNLTAGVRMTF